MAQAPIKPRWPVVPPGTDSFPITSPLGTMARVDSLIWFMAGFAQLFVGSSLEDSILGLILEITGGSSVLLGLYALIFVARHHKEFEEAYSKLEKTTMSRDEQGRIHRIDDSIHGKWVVWYAVPIILTFFAALGWLAN